MKKYREDLQKTINKHFDSTHLSNDLKGFLDDIQEKLEEYEEELEELVDSDAHSRYEKICDQINFGSIYYNRETRHLQSFSKHVLLQFQYTEKDLNNLSLEDLLLPKQPENSSGPVQNFIDEIDSLKPEEQKSFHLKFRKKDGAEVWLETRVVALSPPDESIVVLVLRDIDQAKLEEEKNENLLTKLESVNDELRDFAYVVSHDLKAPLRGIMSITRWLGSDYKDKFDEEGSEMLNLLETRTSRLQQLIDGVLAYSKVSHGREEIEEVDVQELVEGIADFLAPPPHIKIDIKEELPTLYFEPTKLGQIFQNIISNSIKYMDKKEGLIQVGCRDKGDMWEFYISDNGPGIEKTYHDKIFQIFQTLQSRDKVESTGIGLSIVKKIIDKFGGDIWLESSPGEGCTFYFKLLKNIDKVRPNQEYDKWVQSI